MSINQLNSVLCDPIRRASLERRLWDSVAVGDPSECWLWVSESVADYGYGRMTAGRGVCIRAHQAAWALANGPVPDGAVVRHSCDTTACCNPAHLSIGTVQQNVNDCIERHRHSAPPSHRGFSHPKAKLAPSDVQDIASSQERADSLAARFGVSVKTIYTIRRGEHHYFAEA